MTIQQIDLRWKQPPNIESIENYSEGVYSSLLYIMLDVYRARDIQIDHMTSHIGKSFGLCLLLRGTSHHANTGTTYLPASICAKHGVSEDMIYRKQYTKEIGDVVFEVANTAKAHLDLARKCAEPIQIPNDVKRLFQPAIFADMFLYRLNKVNFDIFDRYVSDPQEMRMSFIFNLLKSSFRGGFLGNLTLKT